MLETIMSIQPRGGSGKGKSKDQIVEETAISIQKSTPPVWDIEMVGK
jgi:hypothetical protein